MKRKWSAIGIILSFFTISAFPGLSINYRETNEYKVNNQIEDSQYKSNQLPPLSMFFTKNLGQFPNTVLFQANAPGATIYFCHDKIVSVLTRSVKTNCSKENSRYGNLIPEENQYQSYQREMLSIVAEFQNAKPLAVIIGEGLLSNYNNYFIGNDSTKWYTHVPNYKRILYQEIYPKIDLTYYFTSDGLKYDFIVHPGGNVSQIQICYSGINGVNIDSLDNLNIQTDFGILSENKPFVYQRIKNETHSVPGRFCQIGADMFGFDIDGYDSGIPLIIDPGLNYSTFLGDFGTDVGFDIAVESDGYTYVTGYTESIDFPTTPGAYDTTYNLGGTDVFITKLSPGGDALIYSTFLGGSDEDYFTMGSGLDDLILDPDGSVIITGETESSDFPITSNTYDASHNGGWDVFVAKLSPNGDTLLYSTYLGGSSSDMGVGIAKAEDGCMYITGNTESNDFPTTPYAYDITLNGDGDVFCTKFSSSGTALVFSTFLGGSDWEIGNSIIIDTNGYAVIAGFTYSGDFPTTPEAFDTTFAGGWTDGFVLKISPLGDVLVFSTFLGGIGADLCYDLKMDSEGNTYITGITSSDDFPTTPNAYDVTHNGDDYDIFVSKLTTTGGFLIYSTYLGGIDMESECPTISVEENGEVIIVGTTRSEDFPTTQGSYDSTPNGDHDVFITKLSSSADTLLYSSYIGGTWADYGLGSVVNAEGYVYITGYTVSNNFPTTPNAYDITYDYQGDIFILKLSTENSANLQPIPDFSWLPQNPQIYQTIYFDASTSYDPNGEIILYEWDLDSDGTFEEANNDPLTNHSWFDTGNFYVTLKVTDNENATDTKTKKVTVGAGNQPPIAEFSYAPEKPLLGQPVTFDASASYDPDGYLVSYIWDFGDQTMGIGATTTHVYTDLGHYYVKLTIMDNNNAEDTQVHHFDISPIDVTIQLKGGFGVQAIITNNEISTIDGIPWSVQVKGGIGGHINKTLEGKINIPAGGEKTVETGILFGFGSITIAVSVANEELTAEGIQIFIFSFLRESR